MPDTSVPTTLPSPSTVQATVPPDLHPPAPPTGSRFARALAVTAGARWLGQALRWGSTLVVARILSPADYGLVGMSGFLVALMQIVSEAGLSTAVLRMRHLSDRAIRQLNATALVVGTGAWIGTSALAVPLAGFFHEPRLRVIVPVASFGFVLGAFGTIPNALLQRDLAFRRIATAELTGMLAMALATLLLSLLGFGYWALVAGPLTGTLVTSAVQASIRPAGYARPRRSELVGVLGFSGAVLGEQLTWYLYSNVDNATVGRVLGPAALGVYSIAWALSFVPIEQTNTVISRISNGFYTGLQHDVAEARRLFLRLTGIVSLVTLPACFGLAAVSPAFVRTVLGARWEGAIVPLALLSAVNALRCLTLLFAPLVVAFGDPRVALRFNLVTLVSLAITFPIAARAGGTPAVAAAWTLFLVVQGYPMLRYVQRLIALPLRQYGAALLPGLVASAVMVPSIVLAGLALQTRIPAVVLLVLQIALGVGVFLAVLTVGFRPRVTEIVTALRGMLRRPAAA